MPSLLIAPEEFSSASVPLPVGEPARLQWLTWTQPDLVWKHWRELESRLPRRLTSSFEWTQTWLKHYGDLFEIRFTILMTGDVCRGMALVVTSREECEGPFRLRTLHLGTAGERDTDSICVEDNALLVEANYREEFLRQLHSTLSHEGAWDRWRIDGFTEGETESLLDHESKFIADSRVSWYYDLAASRQSGQALELALGHATRKSIRRKMRDAGSLQLEWADDLVTALDIYSELMTLHQARWQAIGEPGVYSSSRFRDFHAELITKLLPREEVGMIRVRRANGETLGCVQLFIDRNRCLVYQGGWTLNDPKQSPGLVTDFLCMQECLRRGYDAYDFLAGDGYHKERLSTTGRNLVWAAWTRPRLKLSLLHAVRSVKRQISHWRRAKPAAAPMTTTTAAAEGKDE